MHAVIYKGSGGGGVREGGSLRKCSESLHVMHAKSIFYDGKRILCLNTDLIFFIILLFKKNNKKLVKHVQMNSYCMGCVYHHARDKKVYFVRQYC